MTDRAQASPPKAALVTLKPFTEQHLTDPAYRAWLGDRDVVRYLGRPEYLEAVPFEDVRAYVEALWADERCTFLAVHASSDGGFIGTAKIMFKPKGGPSPGVADIGVMIGNRDYWGRGFATAALRATCRHAFDRLGARKLVAGAMSPNVAVIKAFERIGFVIEGRLRQQLDFEGGHVDHVLLGCLPAELRAE
jgi:[ribosomal protein S5]-alanine N-acetyltransferase